MTQPVFVAYCTCPDEASGSRIASALLDRHLAACINLLPGVRSFYRWKGRVENDPEVLLVIKTTADNMPVLREAIRELHSYDVPELIACPVQDGLPDYMEWIREETRCD